MVRRRRGTRARLDGGGPLAWSRKRYSVPSGEEAVPTLLPMSIGYDLYYTDYLPFVNGLQGQGVPNLGLYPDNSTTPVEGADYMTAGCNTAKTTGYGYVVLKIGGGTITDSIVIDQILNGPTQAQYDYHGGVLWPNPTQNLNVKDHSSGVPLVLSSAYKEAFESIIGQTRAVLLHQPYGGRGSTLTVSTYRIVFVRIMAVEDVGPDYTLWMRLATYQGAVECDKIGNVYTGEEWVQIPQDLKTKADVYSEIGVQYPYY